MNRKQRDLATYRNFLLDIVSTIYSTQMTKVHHSMTSCTYVLQLSLLFCSWDWSSKLQEDIAVKDFWTKWNETMFLELFKKHLCHCITNPKTPIRQNIHQDQPILYTILLKISDPSRRYAWRGLSYRRTISFNYHF